MTGKAVQRWDDLSLCISCILEDVFFHDMVHFSIYQFHMA